MEQAPSIEAFVRAPVGKWVLAGQTVVWCASPSLGGGCAWGRPDAVAAATAMRAYVAYRQMGPRLDSIIDGYALELLLPDAVEMAVAWMRREAEELHRRVRRQWAVLPPGVDAITLAGISPIAGSPFDIKFVARAEEAFAEAGAPELGVEIAQIVAEVRGAGSHLVALRALLRERGGQLSLEAAARQLGLSTRTLQRELGAASSSFRAEVRDARFDRIARLLETTDDKIEVIAARVGMTKGALSALVRARTGQRPTELRAARRPPR
jgi:AraC-like DNA-binding protein